MKSNFKILVFAIVGFILFSWLVSCRFGFGSGDNKWESSSKETEPEKTEQPKESDQTAPVKDTPIENTPKKIDKPKPISPEERFKQAKNKREQLFIEEQTLQETIYKDADKKARLIFCTSKKLNNLYGVLLGKDDENNYNDYLLTEVEHFERVLQNTFYLHQGFFDILEKEGSDSFHENRIINIYLSIRGGKNIDQEKGELFEYWIPVKVKTIILPNNLEYTPSLLYVHVSCGFCKCKDDNPISSNAEGKDTATRFFADDIVRALKKLRQYNGLPKTFSRCETKLSVVETKLANIDSGKIEMDDDALSQCEKELNEVEQTLENIKQETSVKVTVEEADINQILSLFNSNKPSSKKVGKQPKSIGVKQ